MQSRFKNWPWSIGFLLWTGLILLSGFGNLRLKHQLIHDLALAEAKGSYNKDLAYRRWASQKGGIYVPRHTTLPNPYLQHLPDRDVTTASGLDLTLVNPAYMTREVLELAEKQYGVQGHITSLNLMRPGNAADPWEKSCLENFEKGASETISEEILNGETYLRTMTPMFVEKPCLKCHEQQGYKTGDIRGGISVSVPLAPYEAAYALAFRSEVFTKTILWLAGTLFLLFSRRYIKSQFANECTARHLAETSEKKYRMLFDQATVGFALSDTGSGKIIDCNQALAKMVERPICKLTGMPENILYPGIMPLKNHIDPSKTYLSIADGDVMEGQLITQSNKLIDVEIKGSTIDLDDRTVLFSFFHDISRRKKQERIVCTLYHAVEQSPAAILLLDLKGHVEYANKRFTELTGFSSEEVQGKTFTCLFPEGGIDPNLLEKISKIRKWSCEVNNTKKDGSDYWEKISFSSIEDENGETAQYLVLKEDITRQKLHEQELEHLATHDELTGLANRTLLIDRLEQAIRYAKRYGHLVGILLLDLNRFKYINDSLGHSQGDLLLQEVASRLKESVRDTDTVARLGGDEFVVILTKIETLDELRQISHKISESLSLPIPMSGREIIISASIGTTVFPHDGVDGETLIRNADIAMYQAKKDRANIRCYHEKMNTESLKILELESELRLALKRDQFVLHYQPKVELATGRIIGAEALLRWRHPQRGMIPPGDFIPLAEETGEILPIGEWVLNEAVRQVKQWQLENLLRCPAAVNVSAKQFQHYDLADFIRRVLKKHDLQPDLLEVELTESMLMKNPKATVEQLIELKRLGVKISLDDFGTGYSSLNYLRRFPVDFLKIDRSFIAEINQDESANSVAKSVVAIAQSLGLKTIAEGVETKEQLDFLLGCGCYAMQGYYYSKPLEAEEFVKMLAGGFRPLG
jgi:diguanylate cyclase (GGDEF)-like protein/PAS domain S-box-containing protein